MFFSGLFSNTSKSGFSIVNSVLFVDVPLPELAHGLLYPPLSPPKKWQNRPFGSRVVSVCPNDFHTSRLKWPLAALPAPALLKWGDTLVRNGGLEKSLYHSRVECPFSIQLIRKRSFYSRVVKVKFVLHCEIEGFGHILEQKVSFRSRVVEVLIFFNGKSE